MNELNDSEWLLARERGEDVSHVPAYTREKYSQLDRLIHDLPTCAPSPGWKQRVLDSLDDSLDDQLVVGRPESFPLATARSRVACPQRGAALSPRRWRWALGSGAASLAAVLAVCAYLHEPRAPELDHALASVASQPHDGRGARDLFDERAIDHERAIEYLQGAAEPSPTAPFAGPPRVGVRRGAGTHRGSSTTLNIGDTLVIDTVADRPIELRVYGDAGEPLARCTEARGCRVERMGAHRRYRLELDLNAPGAVRTVEYTGSAMPATFVSLDEDLEAAGKAGVDMRELSVVHVE